MKVSKSASAQKKESPKDKNDNIFVKNSKLEELSIMNENNKPRITAFWNDLLDDDPDEDEEPEGEIQSPD